MVSFCPTFSLVGWTFGFAASSALSETWLFLAILPSVSPLTTVYSAPAVSVTVGTTTGGLVGTDGTTTGGFDASSGGGLVSAAKLFVSTGGRFSVLFSRVQPG